MNGFTNRLAAPLATLRASLRMQFLVLALIATSFAVSAGCSETESPENNPSDQTTSSADPSAALPPDPASFSDGLTATQILSQTIQQYGRADSYSDRGVLYLSYWMDGRPVQEPQQWSVAWNKRGMLASSLFNSRVQCDANRLSCYVYDIESGNLDGQRLLIEAKGKPPLNELYADSIASHFIGGASELPLNAGAIGEIGEPTAMVPPALGLLTGQMLPGWLSAPRSLVRMADASIDAHKCFVVRSIIGPDQQMDIWIDSQSGIIRQIAFPTTWLDAKVRSAPEITDLQFVARFHEAQFNPEFDASVFELKPIAGSTLVEKFVQLPQAIPAETIGQTAPPFELETLSGKRVSRINFDGFTTVLMWVAGNKSYAGIEKLKQLESQLESQLPAGKFHVAVVYSDPDLAMPESASNSPNMELSQLQQKTRLPFYLDRELSTSSQLKMAAVPGVVVLDGESTVQFARALSDERWVDDVRAAAVRVAGGEDVAAEMLAEYQQFLEQYHTQLTASTARAGSNDLIVKTESPLENPGTLKSQRIWNNLEFRMAGNIVSTARRLFVFDGWRTIVELDATGNEIARYELDLPVNEGVSSLRAIVDQSGRQWMVAFMPSSRAAFLLNDAFDVVGQYPDSSSVARGAPAAAGHFGVLDCQIFQTSDRKLRLAVAFEGEPALHYASLPECKRESVSATAFESIAGDGQVGVSGIQLKSCVDGQIYAASSQRHFSKLFAASGNGANSYLATATDDEGRWFAVGLDLQLNELWAVPIGSQIFENNIVPVAFGERDAVWAVAGADNSIGLINAAGKSAGQVVTKSAISGVAVVEKEGAIELVVSSADGVSAYEIPIAELNRNLPQNLTRPASHHQ